MCRPPNYSEKAPSRGCSTILSKEKRIKKELDRIKFYFELADGNQRAIVTPLLQNAAFMKVTLDDLQEIINKEGVTEIYQNGANQHGIKQSAAVQSYNAVIKNYASVIKTLAGLLPPEERKKLSDSDDLRKAQEEAAKRAEEQRRINMAETALAIEYQRQQREAEAAGKRFISFGEFKRRHAEE